MMAFVHHEMTVIRHKIRYFAMAYETLDDRDIDHTCRFAAPAANDSNVVRIDFEERPETLDPLNE
jgi:hypothetical protein